LRLIADSAHEGRPANADPYDVRDVFDWFEPTIEHDPALLRRSLEPHFLAAHPQLAGWLADDFSAGAWKLVNRFNADPERPGFQQLIAFDGPLTIARRVNLDPRRPTALVRLGKTQGNSSAASYEISVDGRRLIKAELPGEKASPDGISIVVPLHHSLAKSVEISVRFDPGGRLGLIDWRGLILIPDASIP
jgi:hypothetical protein